MHRESLMHAPGADGGEPIACHVREPEHDASGTVLLLHGRDGAGRAAHIEMIADAYVARGWRIVAPDLPNSRATPDSGPPERFTMSGHRRDSGAVLAWVCTSLGADRQIGRLALAGHSVGAFSAAWLASELDEPAHLLAVSPVVSGSALLAARDAMGPAAIEAVAREVPLMLAEMPSQDALPALQQLSCPVAVVTGAEDGLTPPKDARAYLAAASAGCFFAALPGQHHCPTGPAVARALAAALDAVAA